MIHGIGPLSSPGRVEANAEFFPSPDFLNQRGEGKLMQKKRRGEGFFSKLLAHSAENFFTEPDARYSFWKIAKGARTVVPAADKLSRTSDRGR